MIHGQDVGETPGKRWVNDGKRPVRGAGQLGMIGTCKKDQSRAKLLTVNAFFRREKQGNLVADNTRPILNVGFCPLTTRTPIRCWNRMML